MLNIVKYFIAKVIHKRYTEAVASKIDTATEEAKQTLLEVLTDTGTFIIYGKPKDGMIALISDCHKEDVYSLTSNLIEVLIHE